MEQARYPQRDFPDGVADLVAHRPWPLPAAPWLMTQSWHDLLFAHWPVSGDLLAAHVPAEFAIDRFDGRAWIGIVPFYMTNVAPRVIPALPGQSQFPELNVRTYVRVADKPGVFFFSLDAANPIAVRVARSVLGLPYHLASMSVARADGDIHYRSHREGDSAPAAFVATYRAAGPAFVPPPGTLDHFLTERYCLYSRDRRGNSYRLEIHHAPWLLQPAEADVRVNTMASAAGLSLPSAAPLLHFAKRQDTIAWWPTRLR